MGRRVVDRARSRYGLVTTRDLIECGLSRAMILGRVRSGMLTPVHRGVYALGIGPLSIEGRWLAAVLAGGPGCVLSHRSAGALWGVCEPGGSIHVLRTHSRAGVRQQARRTVRPSGLAELPGRPVFHGSMAIRDEETTTRQGIPVTSISRTLIDMAALEPVSTLLDVVDEAARQRLLTPADVPIILDRLTGHRGARRLRRALACVHPRSGETRSRLEVRFAELIAGEHDIPAPQLNVRIGPFEVDVLWPDVGLIVELDGRAFHSSADRFEADRERSSHLEQMGFRVLRLTWRMVNFEGPSTVDKIRSHRQLAAENPRWRNRQP